ncbi:sporulation integral membrane protein YtvI [Alkalihalophilus pseudofirmus]|uniref:sporulation integral membrane protein YtvI n=1 Tax=Alkalihalophilus pseudofirmus TaxID=79885 RepID=UPI0005A28C86|nr:sporulation integral membrane protein YtvI [Alkalihalophilus pseudofirmus]
MKHKFLLVLVICSIIGYFVLPLALPLVFAWLSAVLLSPIVRLLEKRRIKHDVAVVIIFTSFLTFISLIGVLVITKIFMHINEFVQNAPTYLNHVTNAWVVIQYDFERKFEDLPPDFVNEINFHVINTLESTRIHLSNIDFIGGVSNFIVGIPSYLVSFLVYLIALFLFLLDLPTLKSKFYSFLTADTSNKLTYMLSRLRKVLIGFFKAQFIVSIPIFILSYIGLLFIYPDIALIMALVIWFIDLVPLIGSIIILGPWAFYQFIIGDTELAIKLTILAVVLLVIRRTVEPKIMGNQIGLSPLATLIALYLGLVLFGAIGLILGPLLVITFKSTREAGIIKWKFTI